MARRSAVPAPAAAEARAETGPTAPDLSALFSAGRVVLVGALALPGRRARAPFEHAPDLRSALASEAQLVIAPASELTRLRPPQRAGTLVLAIGNEARNNKLDKLAGGVDGVNVLGPSPFCPFVQGGALQLEGRAPEAVGANELAVVVGPGSLAVELEGTLRTRGLALRTLIATGGAQAAGLDEGEVAWGLAHAENRPPRCIGVVAALSPALLVPLARAAERSAVVLLPASSAARDSELSEAAHLRAVLGATGVVLASTLEGWIETLALLGAYAVSTGERVRVEAEPGSALELAARGAGAPRNAGPADITLRAPNPDGSMAPASAEDGLLLPLLAMPGMLPSAALARLDADGRPALIGVAAALEAVRSAVRLAGRRERGLGAAPLDMKNRPRRDREHVARSLERALRLRPHWLSDHDTKILLKSYGIGVTRQGLALSASAAARLATRVGMPAEVRPHGHDLPSEAEGLVVVTDVRGIAQARRAYLICAKLSAFEATVVRETAPAGFEVRVRTLTGHAQGPLIEVGVAREGATSVACAPAPLRRSDAVALAEDERIVRRRHGKTDLDLSALADVLYRLSWMAIDLAPELDELRIERLVVTARGGAGAIAIDTRARVRRR